MKYKDLTIINIKERNQRFEIGKNLDEPKPAGKAGQD